MSPQRSVGDDPTERVTVARYSDLAATKRGLTNRQVDRIVAAFEGEGVEEALVIEEWCDDIDLPTTEGAPQVYFGRVVGESEKAWRFAAGGKVAWVPKSVSTVFENGLAGRNVESPQRGLSDFAGGRS